MSLITSLKSGARVVGRFCKKNSPELLLAAGVATFVGTVVVACKETRRTDEILDEFHEVKDDINKDHAIMDKEDFTEKEYKFEITKLYFRTGGRIALNYAPAAALGGLSLTCFLGSYGILKKRNTALLAAFNTVNTAFQAYRARVIEKEGQDADLYYMTGQQVKTITVKDENGNKVKEKIPIGPADPRALYAFRFWKYKENGEKNQQWSDVDPLFNDMFLRGMQNELNDTLYLRTIFTEDGEHRVIQPGHVFLNEIRDLLGEDHNMVGSIVGNLYSDKLADGCDGYINFNSQEFEEPDPQTGEMIKGWWIYPNVDGVIYDLLDQWKEKGLPDRLAENSYVIDRDLPQVKTI